MKLAGNVPSYAPKLSIFAGFRLISFHPTIASPDKKGGKWIYGCKANAIVVSTNSGENGF